MNSAECQSGNHLWKNDPMFEDGIALIITNDNPDNRLGEEMRQFCEVCGKVRYIQKGDVR